MATEALKDKFIEEFCGKVSEVLFTKDESASIENTDQAENLIDSGVDFLYGGGGKLDKLGDCQASVSGDGSTNQAISCAATFVQGAAGFDPTGLLSIAGTFLRP